MGKGSPKAAVAISGNRSTILVVDDDESQLHLAQEIVGSLGYHVLVAPSGGSALETIRAESVDLVIADLVMPEMDGLELLRRAREQWPELPVIFLTGHDDVRTAVEAIKTGAEDYITKPFDLDRFEIVVAKALEKKALLFDNARLRQMVADQRASFGTLIGSSPQMQALYGQIEAVSPTDSTILLLGESGTGKDLTAREIHRRSKRHGGPFLGVNCGALPSNLLESELFGHEKGAFTGAAAIKVGLFEAADRGTIFLDEIGATTPQTQQSLLRVLQDHEVRRVGGTESRRVDVRVISATNADLKSEMEEGTFRADLFFRLSGVVLRLPPLREREEDISLLIEHFLAQACHRHRKGPLSLSPRALERLQRYSWPGNVRELENVVERAVIFATRRTVGPSDLSLQESEGSGPAAEMTLEELIRSHIDGVLKRCRGNKKQAARLLGIPRTSLYKLLQKHDLR